MDVHNTLFNTAREYWPPNGEEDCRLDSRHNLCASLGLEMTVVALDMIYAVEKRLIADPLCLYTRC